MMDAIFGENGRDPAEEEKGASEADPASMPPDDFNPPQPPSPDRSGASEADPASLPPGVKPA